MQIFIHLSGCPESDETKQYLSLPWYKRMFKTNPQDTYIKHYVGRY